MVADRTFGEIRNVFFLNTKYFFPISYFDLPPVARIEIQRFPTVTTSKSRLNTSPAAMLTATQALSTLQLHRAVAQQPKHRPLHGSLAAEDDDHPMTCVVH